METLTPPAPSPTYLPDEDTAFGALRTLEALDDPTTPEPQRAALRTLEESSRRTLDQYATGRRARGLTLFPSRTAAANKERDTFLKNLHTKPLVDFLPPEDYTRVKQAADLTDDPAKFEQQAANRAFLSAVFGKDLTGASLDAARGAYAARHLNLPATADDATFYNAMRARHAEDDAAGTATAAAARAAFEQTFAGKPAPIVPGAAMPGIPDRHRPAALDQILSAKQQARDIRRRLMPTVERIRGTVERIRQNDSTAYLEGTSRENDLRTLIVSMAENLPDNRNERTLALALLSSELEKLPPESRALMPRVLDFLSRTTNQAFEGNRQIILSAEEAARQFIPADPGSALDQGNRELRRTLDLRGKVAELKDVLQGGAMDINQATDNLLQESVLNFSGSLPYTALALTPYGMPFMAASMAGQTDQRIRTETPEANAGARLAASATSGIAQAWTETALTRAGARIMMGRAPTLTALLNRAGVSSVTGRAALGFAAGATAAGTMETAEEFTQGAIENSMTAAAAEMSGINPRVDWTKFFAGWTSLGQGSDLRETLLAVAPFALLAGGGASVAHVRNANLYLRNTALHAAVGITPEESRNILSQPTPEKSQQALQEAFEDAQIRTYSPEQEAAQAEAKQAALEILRTRARELEKSGQPVITTEPNDFTGEPIYVFTDPQSGQVSYHSTEDEALEKYQDWFQNIDTTALNTIAAAARPDFKNFLLGEGQAPAAANVAFDETGKAKSLGTAMDDAEAALAAAQKQERSGTTAAARREAGETAAAARRTIDAIKSRFKIFLLDHPRFTGSLRDLTIRAESVANYVGRELMGWTVRLYEGSTIQDIAEDVSESVLKNSFANAMLDPHALLDDIRAYESATGRTLIPAGYDPDTDTMPLIEAFSTLARGYLFAESRASELPPTVRQWASMVAAYTAAAADLARSQGQEVMADLSTAADLRAAMAAGSLSPRLRNLLADSIGMNETERQARLQAEMEAQLAAEAMQGYPEIADTLRGRLPHPVTARDQSLPLAGELRRIWESMLRPTRRRTKAGKEIDRTNEANAYFLPVGTTADIDLIRRSVNEEGFRFDTPADMLESLERSIAYNKPTYGTAAPDWGTSSFAVSPSQDSDYLAAVEAGDMETAQRMVDAAAQRAGYLLERFHGTRAKPFTVFKAWSHFGDSEQAREFWGNPDDAANPARIMRLYLAIANPYRTTDDEANSWGALLRKMVSSGLTTNDRWREIESLAKEAAETALAEQGQGRAYADAYNSTAQAAVIEILTRAGHDGIVYANDLEGTAGADSHLPFSANQIKSADPVTRDADGNVIPLSQRFNPADDRITFAVSLPNQKGLPIAGQTPIGEQISDSRPVLSSFQSAPDRSGDLSPRGDGRGLTSFSISRQQIKYEEAKKKVQDAHARLLKAEQANSTDRINWESVHGRTLVLPKNGYLVAWFKRPIDPDELESARKKLGLSFWSFTRRFNGEIYVGGGFDWGKDLPENVAGFSFGDSPALLAHKVIRNGTWETYQLPGYYFDRFGIGKDTEFQSYDYAPFIDREEFSSAREALIQAEVELYLAAEDFNPDQATDPVDPSADPTPLLARNAAQRTLNPRQAAFAALLDARDEQAKHAAKSFVASVWKAYAKHDEIFQFGRTASQKAADIAAAVSTANKPVIAEDSGSTVVFSSGRGFLSIKDADTSRPYISASSASSKGKKQGGGAQLYAAALDWIHNNGKRVKDDPAGLTAINAIRRTSNFFASAIRWGTTRHLKPHADQKVGKWTTNDILNTSLLATKEMENAFKAIPQAKEWTFDFRSGSFNAANGSTLTDQEIETAVASGDPDNSGIGLSTLQRAVITRSAIEAFQRGETLDSLEAPLSNAPDSITGISYALSLPNLLTLDSLLTRLATRGPDERAETYQRMRDRLASSILMLRESKRNIATDQTDAERERNRIRDALMEAQAIIQALPPEARAKVRMPVSSILSATSQRGQISALVRLIAEADDALEDVLVASYRESFEALLDLAKPDLRQNKQLRGRLTPAVQKMVAAIMETVVRDAEAHRQAVIETEAAITQTEQEPADTPEQDAAKQQRIAELSEKLDLLTTFGPYSKLSASELASALESLRHIYTTGRTQRVILDQNRRAEIDAARREVIASNPAINHTRHAQGKNKITNVANFILGLSSFHQVMEWFFPKSVTARDMQDRIRAADRAFTWDKINLRDRYDAFTFAAWNLTGPSRRRRRNQIVHELSKLKEDWGITIKEGVTFEEIKLDEEQAAAILAGRIKPGWETDMIAMQSLADALADFRMQRLKAQMEAKSFTREVIRFRRIKSRGAAADLTVSQLSAAYILQLWAQDQYRPALDKYGFTEDVIRQIEAKLDPRAADLMDFMRDEYDAEYDRLNPVYRAIYNMDMPRIRNYAPGIFEHMDAKSGSDGTTITPEGGAPGVNAMSAGFTKTRQHHMARPDDQANALSQFFAHFESANYFIRYAEIVRDIRQIFRNPEVRRQLNGIHGRENVTLLWDWFDAIELDGRFRQKEITSLARLGNRMLAGRAMTGLAFNLGVLLKQASAATGFLMEMPTRRALSGLWQAITRPAEFKSAAVTLWNHEAIRQRILQGISPEDRHVMNAAANSPSWIMDWLEAGRLPIAYVDAALTTLSGSVAYTEARNAALAANLPASEAEKSGLSAATRVIERTAQPATTQDKSMAELNPGFTMRMLTQFKSDPRQKLAIVANAIMQYRAGRIGKAELARKITFSWLTYGLFNAAMADLAISVFRDDDDPDKWTWQDYLASMAAGPLSAVPVLGAVLVNAFASIGAWTGGKQRPFTSSASPMEDGLDRLPAAWKKSIRLYDELTNEKPSDNPSANELLTAAQQFLGAAASATGDPRAALAAALSRIVRDVQGASANLIDAVTTPTDDDNALAIAREFADTDTKTRDGNADRRAKLAREIAAMEPDKRAAAIARLDKSDAQAVRIRLKRASMTASESKLADLSASQRAAAIEKILSPMSNAERARTLDRYRSIGLMAD